MINSASQQMSLIQSFWFFSINKAEVKGGGELLRKKKWTTGEKWRGENIKILILKNWKLLSFSSLIKKKEVNALVERA